MPRYIHFKNFHILETISPLDCFSISPAVVFHCITYNLMKPLLPFLASIQIIHTLVHIIFSFFLFCLYYLFDMESCGLKEELRF